MYNAARVSKGLTYESAACLRARYRWDVTNEHSHLRIASGF